MLDNEFYNMDCIEGMRQFPDKFFDIAVVDPPYGQKEHGGKNRGKYVKQKNGSKIYVQDGRYDNHGWDDAPPAPEYFKELRRVSKHQIIWGINYFDVSFGPGRIVWDKCNDGSDQSDAEIAYNSLTDRIDIFRYMWRGMMQGRSINEGWIQQGNKALNEHRIHPTQKPVNLYRWIVQKYIQPGWRVLDTHVGSASSLIAYEEDRIPYVGFEVDAKYYQEAQARLEAERAQYTLFGLYPEVLP